MKSRAALRTHPLHPAMVPLPIGAFFLALVGPDGLVEVRDFGVFSPWEKAMRVFSKTGRIYRIGPVPGR